MTYDPEWFGGPIHLGSKSNGRIWMLDTVDAVATAIASGYVSDGFSRGVQKGDFAVIRKFSDLTTKATLNSVSMHYVTACTVAEDTTFSAAFGDTSGLTTLVASGTGTPAVTDDSADGYSVGSIYVETDADVIYGMTDSTVGAAVWKPLSTVLSGTATPDVNYDQVDGAVVGTTYVDTDSSEVYICDANGAGIASWIPVSDKASLDYTGLSSKGADAAVARFVAPFKFKILKMYTVLNAALATGDATFTTAIAGTGVTNGVATATQAGSAAGDIDVATPTALNTGVAGALITVTGGGASTATATANVAVVLQQVM